MSKFTIFMTVVILFTQSANASELKVTCSVEKAGAQYSKEVTLFTRGPLADVYSGVLWLDQNSFIAISKIDRLSLQYTNISARDDFHYSDDQENSSRLSVNGIVVECAVRQGQISESENKEVAVSALHVAARDGVNGYSSSYRRAHRGYCRPVEHARGCRNRRPTMFITYCYCPIRN